MEEMNLDVRVVLKISKGNRQWGWRTTGIWSSFISDVGSWFFERVGNHH